MKMGFTKLAAVLVLTLLVMVSFTGAAAAQQSTTPPNTIRLANGDFAPAPGYNWLTSDVKDVRVRWSPGLRHPDHPNVLASQKEGNWLPAPGYLWVNNVQGDLRVSKVGPTNEDIGKAALKAVGAFALHQASRPQPGDGIGEGFTRALAREGRDALIDSALKDLLPAAQVAERSAIRGLVVLALDKRLDRNRDRVVAQLRMINPDMADVVEIAEFLIRVAQAIDQSK